MMTTLIILAVIAVVAATAAAFFALRAAGFADEAEIAETRIRDMLKRATERLNERQP